MKYWLLHAETPYCGEDCYEYIEAETYDEAAARGDELMYENANDWYDEEVAETYDWEDYIFECGIVVEEVTYEEYKEYITNGK